jgi:hypothetical protein
MIFVHNFLYEDAMDGKYSNQIKTSRARYWQVKTHVGKEIQAIICFSGEFQEKIRLDLMGDI